MHPAADIQSGSLPPGSFVREIPTRPQQNSSPGVPAGEVAYMGKYYMYVCARFIIMYNVYIILRCFFSFPESQEKFVKKGSLLYIM